MIVLTSEDGSCYLSITFILRFDQGSENANGTYEKLNNNHKKLYNTRVGPGVARVFCLNFNINYIFSMFILIYK